MPLKILLADDSMTAQKMGKDILTGAGYEVIAVSNGAAAAKKLAEKPDIAIFDIIMPGYSGVELCEKVRAAHETAKLPVLLTVGKMEHYEQKEVQRVKADGVIVKPFEASDLLAAVKKLAEIANPPKPTEKPYEKTMIFTPPTIEEFRDESYAAWKTDTPAEQEDYGAAPPPAVTMSKEAASAPAFMMDDPDATVTAAPASTSFDETVSYEPPHAKAAAAAVGVPEIPSMPTAPMDEVPAIPISPFMELETVTPPPAASAAGAEVEQTAHASVNVSTAPDPALVLGPSGYSDFATTFTQPKVEEAAAATSPEDDFEARVAAAMSGYSDEPTIEADKPAEVESAPPPLVDTASPTVEVEPEPPRRKTEEIALVSTPVPEVETTPDVSATISDAHLPPEGMQDASLVEQMQAAVEDMPVATTPVDVEAPPPAAEMAAASPAPEPPAHFAAQDLELAKALAAAVGAEAPPSAIPGTTSGNSISIDPATAAQAVQRVLERMMPSIMQEVHKELDKK